MKKIFLSLALAAMCAPWAAAQQTKCVDAADEPHHHVVYQDSSVRIFLVELGRLESTQQYCNPHPFFRVAATPGRVTNTNKGEGPVGREWVAGDAVFVASPEDHVLRNERSDTFRELEIETLHRFQEHSGYVDCYGNDCYAQPEPDSFPPDLGDVGNWTINFTRGGVTLTKTRLIAGAKTTLDEASGLLLAITESSLDIEVPGSPAKGSDLEASQVILLPGSSKRTVTNTGRFPAEFLTVEY